MAHEHVGELTGGGARCDGSHEYSEIFPSSSTLLAAWLRHGRA